MWSAAAAALFLAWLAWVPDWPQWLAAAAACMFALSMVWVVSVLAFRLVRREWRLAANAGLAAVWAVAAFGAAMVIVALLFFNQ